MSYRLCAVIPSRNHHQAIGDIVRHLRAKDITVFVVDDGSAEPARSVLQNLDAPADKVFVHRFDTNRGKGSAVLHGMTLAAEAGFTHAIQVDADGQHDLNALPDLLEASRLHPEALVTGAPEFDATMPWARRLGRWITHFWVCVELRSWKVIDSMCGFRIYPIAPTLALAHHEGVRLGMEFDTEILVRLAWHGREIVRVPVRVVYPPENISNFNVWRDNWRISAMHTRLVLTMIARLPREILRGGRHRPLHWSAMAERGLYWGLCIAASCYRIGGPRLCRAALLPVILYFHATGREQRAASRLFLTRAFAAKGDARHVGWRDTFRHFRSFARKAIETFGAWVDGRSARSMAMPHSVEPPGIRAANRGIVLIVSHCGNAELSRAMLDPEMQARMTLIVHTRHAEAYNRVLRRFSPAAAMNTIQVDAIGPDTIIALQALIERGHWICIAGDRTPVLARDRVGTAPFLSHPAEFPFGPYVIAHLLGCPVYLMFCLREDVGYRVYFEPFADRIVLPARAKADALNALVRRYAARLEAACLRDPYQWYNFYDFWMRAEHAQRSSPR